MNVNITASLLVPSDRILYGGSNPTIATFSGSEDIELSPTVLAGLLREPPFIEIRDINLRVEKYSEETNTLKLKGHAQSADASYFKKLEAKGWIFSSEALAYYGLA